MGGVASVNVLDHLMQIVVVGGAVGARRLELDLDAAVVHDHGRAAELDRLVGQMSHVVVLGRAGETGQHEEHERFGRAQIRPVDGQHAAVVGFDHFAVVVVFHAALDHREHDRVERGRKAPDGGSVARVDARELVEDGVRERAFFGYQFRALINFKI